MTRTETATTEAATTETVINLDEVPIDPRYAHQVPAQFAMRKRLLPLCRIGQEIWIGAESARDASISEALQRFLSEPLRVVPVERKSLQRAFSRVYGSPSQRAAQTKRSRVSAASDGANDETEAAETIALTDEILSAAVLHGASDIHLLPSANQLAVLLRRDGELQRYRELPKVVQPAVIGRLKVLSGMDIAEKRAPQDGRFNLSVVGVQEDIDVRVASLPTRYGERLTLRLLNRHAAAIELGTLGFTPQLLKPLTDAIQLPHGLILLTGPTGSGKTTTLYAAINRLLSKRHCNVITVEDPVEYEIEDVSQVEIDQTDKVSFHRILRSMLRHDPDVIMIGEIRDSETADIALKAALTGHLVLSTLHTNTAAGVVTRLLDMGIEPFLLAATLRLAVAQRLVRKLCPHCRQLSERSASNLRTDAFGGCKLMRSYEPRGCIYCSGQGFVGRIAIVETMQVDQELTELLGTQPREDAIVKHLRGKHSLLVDDAIEKVEVGITTLEEVIRATVIY